MESSRNHRRAGTASVLAGLVIGVVLGASACSGDGESSARPSAGVSVDRPSRGAGDAETGPPANTRTVSPPSRTAAEPTPSREPERTTAPAEATTRPTTAAAVIPPPRTQATRTTEPAEVVPPPAAKPPTTTPATTASASAVAAESTGIGPYGWLLVIVLLAALIVGGLLIYRAQRRSAWDSEARALEAETRTVTAARLPPVLAATAAAQRGLAWPPVRAGLVDLVDRWNGLIERASGDARRSWSLQISGLLQDLIAAVDAENQALAVGQDWRFLRPRVSQAEQALSTVLARQPQAEPPPAAEEPGPPAFQT